MRTTCFLIFLNLSLICISQTNTMNFRDSLGHKQGLWLEYDSLDIEGYSISEQLIPDSTGKSDNEREEITKYEVITHKGNYSDGKKCGIWEIIKPNNFLWMKIKYNNGKRFKIEIFYTNHKPLYLAERIDNDFFSVKEFSKTGKLLKEQKKAANYIDNIAESKLFILGY